MGPTFTEFWPCWPKDSKGKVLVDVVADCDVDALFKLLFAPGSAFMARSMEARGNKEHGETPWLSTPEDLEASTIVPPVELPEKVAKGKGGFDAAGTLQAGQLQGRLRKVGFNGSGMGLKFRSEEVQRCTVAKPKEEYVVDCTVHTTATYGETFRAICRYRLASHSSGKKSTLEVEFQLAYISSVNKFIRSCIERGADSGISKSFAQFIDALRGFVPLQDGKALRAGANPQAEAAQPAAVAAGGAWWRGALQQDLVSALEPLIAWATRGPPHDPAAGSSLGAQGAAVALMLGALWLAMAAIHSTHALCRSGGSPFAKICDAALELLDAPLSVRQVASSLLLLVAAQVLLLQAVRAAPGLIEMVKMLRPRRASVPGSSAANSPRSLDEAPRKGVRFEGYTEAVESASAEATEAAKQATSGSGVSSSMSFEKLRATYKGYKRLMTESFTSTSKPAAAGENGAPPRPQAAPQAIPFPAELLEATANGEVLPMSPTSGWMSPQGPLSPSAKQSPFHRASQGSNGTLSVPGGERSSEALSRLPGARDAEPEVVRETDSEIVLSDEEAGSGPTVLASHARSGGSVFSDNEDEPHYITGPVEVEVFENERLQPFRGWGYSWPGHFLPTDRVGHWSRRNAAVAGRDSMSFRCVAPQLPPGWRWAQDKWHVDLSGLLDGSVDEEGWTYAVDFHWIKYPPAPNSGKKKVKDFVRRRRWRRIRVPLDPREAAVSNGEEDGSSGANGVSLHRAASGGNGDRDLLQHASPPPPSTQLHEALSFPSPSKALQAVLDAEEGMRTPDLLSPSHHPAKGIESMPEISGAESAADVAHSIVNATSSDAAPPRPSKTSGLFSSMLPSWLQKADRQSPPEKAGEPPQLTKHSAPPAEVQPQGSLHSAGSGVERSAFSDSDVGHISPAGGGGSTPHASDAHADSTASPLSRRTDQDFCEGSPDSDAATPRSESLPNTSSPPAPAEDSLPAPAQEAEPPRRASAESGMHSPFSAFAAGEKPPHARRSSDLGAGSGGDEPHGGPWQRSASGGGYPRRSMELPITNPAIAAGSDSLAGSEVDPVGRFLEASLGSASSSATAQVPRWRPPRSSLGSPLDANPTPAEEESTSPAESASAAAASHSAAAEALRSAGDEAWERLGSGTDGAEAELMASPFQTLSQLRQSPPSIDSAFGTSSSDGDSSNDDRQAPESTSLGAATVTTADSPEVRTSAAAFSEERRFERLMPDRRTSSVAASGESSHWDPRTWNRIAHPAHTHSASPHPVTIMHGIAGTQVDSIEEHVSEAHDTEVLSAAPSTASLSGQLSALPSPHESVSEASEPQDAAVAHTSSASAAAVRIPPPRLTQLDKELSGLSTPDSAILGRSVASDRDAVSAADAGGELEAEAAGLPLKPAPHMENTAATAGKPALSTASSLDQELLEVDADQAQQLGGLPSAEELNVLYESHIQRRERLTSSGGTSPMRADALGTLGLQDPVPLGVVDARFRLSDSDDE